MKKTFRFLSMAALLVVGAIMTGCNSDDNIDNPQQPANNDNVVTLTATVSLDGGAATRAIDPSDGTKTFEAGKQIAVFYEDEEGNLQKAESGALTLSTDKKKATFTVTLTSPKSGGNIRYVYPATMAKALDATPPAYPAAAAIDDVTIDYTGLLGSQDGTLTTLANYDLAVKDATLSGTDQPISVTLTNPLAICTLILADGSSPITSDVKSLTISDGTNTYAVTPSSQSPIYVAMKPVASSKIAFTAATNTKTYFKTTTAAQTLAASTLYTSITVGMQELAVGSVICSDGSVYATTGDATAAGATAVAKIAYLGSENGEAAPYNHGLALALSNAGGNSTFHWKESNTDSGHTKQTDSDSFTSESGLQYNATHNSDTYPAFKAAIANNSTAAPTGCSAWFLASGYQWKQMITAAGGADKLGLEGFYWLSTEYDDSNVWYFNPQSNNWSYGTRGGNRRVRSCLAF